MSTPSQERAVIVGGGVIGAACAYYLAQLGRSVILLERGEFGAACSHGNCGLVCPSHALPLCGPGAVRETLRAMLRPGSAFGIAPRFDPGLWAWLLKFSRNCTREKMLAGARARQTLLQSSRTLYEELVRDELRDCEWTEDGVLFVYKSPGAFEHYAATDQLLRNEFGLAAKAIDSEDLLAMEPSLLPDVAGAWHYQTDAHLRPDRLMSGWKRALERLGVEIREHCDVLGFEPAASQRRLTRALTSGEPVEGETFLIAAGAWTPLLTRELGVRVPIQPGKGYSLTMPRPANCPRYPMIFEEHRVAVTPWASGYRIGSTMEFSGYDTRLNRRRMGLLKSGAKLYLHEPMAEPVLEEWYGFRPMSVDDLPIIGPTPRYENVILAAGHGMVGVSMATATGRLAAELATGAVPHIDPAPFSARRFG
ncbi:MAG: FAD-dependent oxidoreductase [Planctomyces sp.]|nr:FAD-dependent oxidoreductase [Planctomyces sp.]